MSTTQTDSVEHEQLHILAFSTANQTLQAITAQLKMQLPKSARLIVAGKKGTDIVMSGLIRVKRRGKNVKYWWREEYKGIADESNVSSSFEVDTLEVIDHLQRRSKDFTWSHHNLLSIYECKHYYHIVTDVIANFLMREKINLVLFFDIPHLFYDNIAYQVAKAKGIETLIFCDSIFPHHFASFRSIGDHGRLPEHFADEKMTNFIIDPDETPDWHFLRGVRQYRGKLGKLNWQGILLLSAHMFKNESSKLLNLKYWTQSIHRMKIISEGFPEWRYPFNRYFQIRHLCFFERILEYENSEVDLDRKFVYFPLHLQPEMSTSTLGGIYSDQLSAIETLARIIPDDYFIYIKENPKQRGQMRGKQFFSRLDRIRKVKVLPSYVDTHELIRQARYVATITGTAGYEAICKGKNVLYFGMPWYRDLEGAIAYSNDISHEEIICHKFNHASLERSAGFFKNRLHEGAVIDISEASDGRHNVESNAKIVVHSILRLIRKEIDTTFVAIE